MECVLSPYVSYPFDHIQSFPALIPELGELLSGNDYWNNDIFVSGYEDDLILRSPTKKRKRSYFDEEITHKKQKTSVSTVLETPPRSIEDSDCSLSMDEVMSPGPMYSNDYMSQDSQDYIEQSDTSEAETELSMPPKRTLKRRATRRTQSLDLTQSLDDDEDSMDKKRPSKKRSLSPSVSPSKNRGARRRSHFLKATTDRLKQWLLDHIDHPYPSEEEKISLSSETGLTIKQINYWFTNSRRRFLKKWREEHQLK